MKLPTNEETFAIGQSNCRLHNRVMTYAILFGLNMKTKIVKIGLVCSECYNVHGEKVKVTEKNVTLQELGDESYFEGNVL